MTHIPPPLLKDHLLAQARAELAAGRLDRASELCRQGLEAFAEDAGMLELAGLIALGSGDGGLAVALLRRAVALAPEDPGMLCHLGLALVRGGFLREARAVLSGLLAKHPRCPGARAGLASAQLPGDDYLSVLADLHDILRPSAYVEIGVETGTSLALARPPTIAIGIDPAPKIIAAVSTGTRIFATTSDHFFESQDLTVLLDGRKVGMAFIDGLHTFDQALKDFVNLERHADPRAVMVFHDVLPLDEISSARVRASDFWTGDTWKIVPALRRARPDLTLFIVPAAPSGLLVVTGLDPQSTALSQGLEGLVADLMPLTFGDWHVRQREFRALSVPNRRAAVAGHLARVRG